jgi:hypothetical protein
LIAPTPVVRLSTTDYSTLPFPTTNEFFLRPIIYLDSAPGLRFDYFYGSSSNRDALVSPNTFLKLSQGKYTSIEQLPIRRILVKMKKELTINEYNALSNAVLLSIKGNIMKPSSGTGGSTTSAADSTKYIMPKESVTMWSLQGECVILNYLFIVSSNIYNCQSYICSPGLFSWTFLYFTKMMLAPLIKQWQLLIFFLYQLH